MGEYRKYIFCIPICSNSKIKKLRETDNGRESDVKCTGSPIDAALETLLR